MNQTAIQFYDQHPQLSDLYHEVLDGLSKQQKRLPPKLFYDETGSKLFDKICEQEEYYPSRTEIRILEKYKNEIANTCGSDTLLLELGSGASKKVRLILESLRPMSYMGVDISKEFLISSATKLAKDYPWLAVHATCADFCNELSLEHCPDHSRKLAFFPGSSIGNFTPTEAHQFLYRLGKEIGDDGYLLIGVDLIKEHSVLNNAYNDQAGTTAEFNLNLLHRLNNELNADFELSRFEHYAYYNKQKSRIEMHLRSLDEQTVSIADNDFYFQVGETIHTENSYKYSIDSFRALASSAGFEQVNYWTDEMDYFSVQLYRRKA